MADDEAPRTSDVEEASSQLNEGLRVCRSVIDNYRAMIGRSEITAGTVRAANDDSPGEEPLHDA